MRPTLTQPRDLLIVLHPSAILFLDVLGGEVQARLGLPLIQTAPPERHALALEGALATLPIPGRVLVSLMFHPPDVRLSGVLFAAIARYGKRERVALVLLPNLQTVHAAVAATLIRLFSITRQS